MAKILLIEDNLEILENIAELLESEDHKVITACCGQCGINKADQLLPDLVISDIMMPGMDGFDVLKRLNNNPNTRFIPVIFLTAKAEKSERKKGLEMGAKAYLVKPFNIEELFRTVENCLPKKTDLNHKFHHDLSELNDYVYLDGAAY